MPTDDVKTIGSESIAHLDRVPKPSFLSLSPPLVITGLTNDPGVGAGGNPNSSKSSENWNGLLFASGFGDFDGDFLPVDEGIPSSSEN